MTHRKTKAQVKRKGCKYESHFSSQFSVRLTDHTKQGNTKRYEIPTWSRTTYIPAYTCFVLLSLQYELVSIRLSTLHWYLIHAIEASAYTIMIFDRNNVLAFLILIHFISFGKDFILYNLLRTIFVDIFAKQSQVNWKIHITYWYCKNLTITFKFNLGLICNILWKHWQQLCHFKMQS